MSAVKGIKALRYINGANKSSLFLLKNRRALFLKGRLLKNLLNASRLIYVLNVMCRFLPIYKRYKNFETDIDIHQRHADLIRKRSLAFDRNEK